MIRIPGDARDLLTPGATAPTPAPAGLPLERLATGPVPAWELGRRLTVPGQVRRDPLDGSGYRCGFVTADGRVVAVHRDHGLRILTDGRARAGWAGAAEVTHAAAHPDGMVLTGPAGVVLRRPDGTGTPLLDARRLPAEAWPPAAAGLLGGGDLVLALPRLGQVLVVTLGGRIRRRLGSGDGLDEPAGVSVDPDGSGFLIADARAHGVFHVAGASGAGPVRLVHGRTGRAGKGAGLLNAPRHACVTASGGVLVADTKNNRVLEVAGGAVVRTWGRTDAYTGSALRLWHPNTAVACPDGSVLVAEGRGDRLLRLGDGETPTVLLGRCDIAATELIQPRGAHFVAPDRVLVADCHNDRVLDVTPTGQVRRVLPAPAPALGSAPVPVPVSCVPPRLDWPRFATASAEGTLVADGRRRRLLCLDGAGAPRWQLTAWRPRGEAAPRPFGDPHHVVVTSVSPFRMLVTDSETGTVGRIDRRGVADWWHGGLSDPHMALPLPDGGVLVCDTGADRLVHVDRYGRRTTWLDPERVRADTGTPLCRPRSMARLRDGALLVVDTGHHRVLLVRPDGRVRSLSPALDGLVGSLFFPRHVAVDAGEQTLLLSDFDNSRLVFLGLPALLEVCGG